MHLILRESYYTPPYHSGEVRPSIIPSVSLSYVRPSVFSFPDDDLSKCQWIFTKLGVCMYIVKILFGQISLIFDRVISARDRSVFSFSDDNFSKYQRIFIKLGVCIDIVKICFEIADGQISSILHRVICPRHVRIFISGR